MLWQSVTSSRMRNDFQYSVQFSYNTFPVPNITPKQKDSITLASINIIEVRELFPEKKLAELYDPDKMPDELLKAHQSLDEIVDSLYSENKIESDEDRLQALFSLYTKMTGCQNA